jgi:type IV pilus assembly protein PilP
MRASALFICFALASAMLGCSNGEHEDIKQWMADASRDLKGKVPPLPELRPFPIAPYEAKNQVDPFSIARIEPEKKEGSGVNKPDFDRPREQLEAFSLETLQFIGVIRKSKGRDRRALIRADNAIYQVGIGNYMGENFGRIVEISDAELILKETVQDPTGQTTDWVEREATLQLLGEQGKEAGK